jgi:hypothetical protein
VMCDNHIHIIGHHGQKVKHHGRQAHEPYYFSTRWNTNIPNILSEA